MRRRCGADAARTSTRCAAALERHGGTVEKFIGDAVVAVFGVPEAHEDDALRACRAALEMQARLAALNEELERRFGTRIAVRIGVNTRRGRRRRSASRETFVTGDAVNVAARLEQAAGPGEVLLGEATYRLVRDAVAVEPVEPLAAKGKSEPLRAYRLLEVSGSGRCRGGRGRRWSGASESSRCSSASSSRGRRAALPAGHGRRRAGRRQVAARCRAGRRIGARARVVRGACLSYGEGITYWAVGADRARAGRDPRRALARGGARAARRPLAGVRTGRVAARIAQLLGLAEGVGDRGPDRGGDRGASSPRRPRERPLVVLVDDIHWAEPALLDLLAGAARRDRGRADPAALPGPAGAARGPARLAGDGAARAARRGRGRRAAREPAARPRRCASGSRRPPPATRCSPRSSSRARRRGRLRRGRRLTLEASSTVALPTSLNALLGARLDRLDAEARDALERGAVEGELFHRGAVVELSEPASRRRCRPSSRRSPART